MKTSSASGAAIATELYRELWGDGERVVLVHGSLATGAPEWDAQRPLADDGFQLVVFDRRGYGKSPNAPGEDYLADADDIVGLMGDGAHLVGHSYGGLGAMFAAARRPEVTKSLTVLEAPAPVPGLTDPAWNALLEGIRTLWGEDLSDREWVVRFLHMVGSDVDLLPPDVLAEVVPLTPVFRRGRPFYDANVPLAELAATTFPKLVVSGGHHTGFEAMCDALALCMGAARVAIEGAGHEIQFTGAPVNEALTKLWRRA